MKNLRFLPFTQLNQFIVKVKIDIDKDFNALQKWTLGNPFTSIFMKHKKTITSIAFFLLGVGGLQAQESMTAAGGNGTGSGGTIAYSVGQLVYTSDTETGSSVTKGVQQPFEISTTLGINETSINLELSVKQNLPKIT